MTADEATRVLQRFGEGIDPVRDMFGDPTHDDWHEAAGVLCGVPWKRPDHAGHHRRVAEVLGLDPPGSFAEHAQHSTLVMAVLARRVGASQP